MKSILFYLFYGNYRSPFSRYIYKTFFGLLQIFKKNNQRIQELDYDQKIKFDELYDVGYTIIDKNITNYNFNQILKRAINTADEIFQNNYSFNNTDKNYLKSIDISTIGNSTKIFHDLFTNNFLISIISKYLNDKPLLTELKLLYSPPSFVENFSGSQLLHSDHDDTKVVKIFVFVDDVDMESGPLELVNIGYSKKILKLSKYRWGQKSRKYMSHDDKLINLISDKLPNEILNSMIGKEVL